MKYDIMRELFDFTVSDLASICIQKRGNPFHPTDLKLHYFIISARADVTLSRASYVLFFFIPYLYASFSSRSAPVARF